MQIKQADSTVQLTTHLLVPLSTTCGRIYDGKNCGVLFVQGGKGRVEDCQIWGSVCSGVAVQDHGAEAVVVGCKCAGGRAGTFCWRLVYF